MKYDEFFKYDEKYLKVTKYEVLGKLPDPFIFKSGKALSCVSEWPERRKEILSDIVGLQYGTMPPAPEVLTVDPLMVREDRAFYKVTAGTKEKNVQFVLRVITPPGVENPPVVVEGDLCFHYGDSPEYLEEFLSRGIAYASFNRTELAHDIQYEGRRKGALYDVYPEYGFGALGAWAWGFMRATDALEKIGRFDLSALAYTGHSRGAKTAMLAGILDERAKIVNPNETNQGSCSCYRIHMAGIGEDGIERPSETLSDLYRRFDFWLGEGMKDYAENEKALPFDAHFVKAAIAPRVLLVGEAGSDLWTNPIGTWQTSEAAREVYKFLGCEENMLWYFRTGFHYHHPADAQMLAMVVSHVRYGTPLPGNRFYRTPFEQPEKIWDWKTPSAEK